ncbi:hypothetical protein BH10BAC5_BH10BAC5_28690 [soil metagenome]
MRSSYKIHNNEYPHFITSTIVEWIPIFTNSKYSDILVNALKYYQQNKDLKIFSYVILDNHFHMVCRHENLSRIISDFKKYTAKEIISSLQSENKTWQLNLFKFYKKEHKAESEYQVWQEGFHPIQISSEVTFNQKCEYIHYNPVRRGLVENAEDWKYSSAGYYLKDRKGVLEIDSF